MRQQQLIRLAAMIPYCSGLLSPLLGRQLVTPSISIRAPSFLAKNIVGATTTTSTTTTRLFASSSKKKQPKRLSSKQRRKRESEKQKRRNEYRARQSKLKRQKNLHKAGKMKRILSATDYWFSESNLVHDYHLQEQLYLYKGHVPLKELLTFPKFEHWVDLPLLYDAYTNPAAKKRYHVVVSPDLMEHGKQQVKRRQEAQRQAERNRAKREKELKRKRRKRAKERKRIRQEREEEVFDIVRQRILQERKEWLREEREKEEAKHKEALLEESSVRGFLERNRTFTEPVINLMDAVVSMTSPPNEEDELTLDDIDDDAVFEAIYCGEYDEYVDYLELNDLEDDDDYDDEYDDRIDDQLFMQEDDWSVWPGEKVTTSSSHSDDEKQTGSDSPRDSSNVLDFDPLLREQDADPSSLVENETHVSNSTATADEKAGEKESRKEDDGTVNLEHALLRHKRVTFEYLEKLRNPLVIHDWNDEACIYDGYNDVHYGDPFMDEWGNEWNDRDDKPKQPKRKEMQQYRIDKQRQVVLIQTPEKLKNFCAKLLASVRKNVAAHGNRPQFSAIGFDVEYCSLELDIRGTLPAMLQLAGPGEKAPIGLIWLDKFPNHGRDMLGMETYKPLFDILGNYEILKVGVGASKDVRHLASWWGINDREYTDYYFAGIFDLEDEGNAGENNEKSLAEMCKAVLGKSLPKSKQKLSKKEKKRKKEGRRTPTAHWRRKVITKEMKEYAANDVACSIDIWMKLKSAAAKEDEDEAV